MTRVVDVGTPSSNFEEDWTTTNVRFHGFADLSTTRGEEVESPEFACFGHNWELVIYPGGDDGSDDGYVAVYLCNMSNPAIKIHWCYSIRDADGKEVVFRKPLTDKFAGESDDGDDATNSLGDSDFAKRSKLIKALVKGALIIEVRMRLIEASKLSSQFIPTNPLNNIILREYILQ